MGRPINSRHFGPDAGGDGFQITGLCFFAGGIAAEACYIIQQRSNKKFEVADAATGLKTAFVSLTDQVLAEDDGSFHILVNGGEHAKNIRAHRVSTFEGNGFVWNDMIKAADAIDDVVDADLGADIDVDVA